MRGKQQKIEINAITYLWLFSSVHSEKKDKKYTMVSHRHLVTQTHTKTYVNSLGKILEDSEGCHFEIHFSKAMGVN